MRMILKLTIASGLVAATILVALLVPHGLDGTLVDTNRAGTLPDAPAITERTSNREQLQPSAPLRVEAQLARETPQLQAPPASQALPERLGDLEAATQRAEQYLAACPLSGDLGHDTTLKLLRQFLDNGCKMSNLNPVRSQAIEWEANASVNPSGVKLSESDRSRLQTLLDQQNKEAEECRSCEYIESMLGLSEALRRGDFMAFPSPKTTEEEFEFMDKAKAAAKWERERDFNLSALPGPSRESIRIVALKEETAPRYIAIKRHRQGLGALHEYAIRSFFLPR